MNSTKLLKDNRQSFEGAIHKKCLHEASLPRFFRVENIDILSSTSPESNIKKGSPLFVIVCSSDNIKSI